MKSIVLFLCLFILLPVLTQDKRYTNNSENGYMWLDFEKRMIAKNVKYDFLSSMLENDKLKKLSGNYKDEFGCDNDIKIIQIGGNQVDLVEIEKLIDEFYSFEDNLIIPIRYAYCYCIKQLAGNSTIELETYKDKLINFSKPELK